MGKLQSSSYSSSSSSKPTSGCVFLYIIYSILCLFLRNANANGFKFNPLIQLPTCGLFAKTCRPSTVVVLNVLKYGAKGDGVTDDTKSFQEVWKVACSLSLQAKIVIPAGKFYLLGPIDFAGPCQSEVTLRVSGAIVAPQDPSIWDGLNPRKWLYFHGVSDLTVVGGGIIDGSGQEWWARSCKINVTNPCTHAPTAITFHRCKNLKVRNITTLNSQQMHMAFTRCKGVQASHVKVLAPADSPNTDGIHISASNHVELKDITISTGDDCISIVSNSSRIRIKSIFCRQGHGISIGSLGKSNSLDTVQDVVVDSSFLSNTENGVRIKTWQGGSGFVRKVTFQNIWMENVSNPIIIDQYYCDCPSLCLNKTSAVKIENISFRHIRGTSTVEEAIRFACSDNFPCRWLYLEDIHLVPAPALGMATNSFCWEAYGSSSGQIYPQSCLSSLDIVIQHGVPSNNISQHKDV